MTYKNTKSARLLSKHGKETIKNIWFLLGHTKSAEYLNTTPAVIRSLVESNGWQRPVEFIPGLKRAIEDGTRQPEDYPHIDFSGEFMQTFLEQLQDEQTSLLELALKIQQEFLLTPKTNEATLCK